MVMAREGSSITFFFSHENLRNFIMRKKEKDALYFQRERETLSFILFCLNNSMTIVTLFNFNTTQIITTHAKEHNCTLSGLS